MKIALNTFFWTLFVCFIGCAQIGIVWFYSTLNGIKMGGLTKFYGDGFFLFFSISLIAGIIYEFYIENDCRVTKSIKNLLLIISAGVGVMAMLTYALAFASSIESPEKIGNYVNVQNYLTILAILVSIVMKGIIYKSR